MHGQLSLVSEARSPRRLSVTSLVELRRCPRRFAFTEVEGNRRLPPAHAALGAAVHRALQGLHVSGSVESSHAADAVRPFLEAFRRSRLSEQRLVAAELPVRLRRGGFVIAGRVDAVFCHHDDPSGWELVDFKTGGAPADPDPADDAQLEVYALAAIEHFGRDPERVTTTYLHLGTGEARTRRWTRRLADEAAARLAADLARIDAGRFPAWPNRTCSGCDALDICAAGQSFVASLSR